MIDLWSTYSVTDLWEFWSTFKWLSVLWKPSLLDNSKLTEAVKTQMEGREFERMLNIISVDLSTGDIIVFDETTPVEK